MYACFICAGSWHREWHIHTGSSCLISSNGSVFNPTGMGKSIQYVEQQCSVWRKEAIWYRYVFLDIPVFFPQALAMA